MNLVHDKRIKPVININDLATMEQLEQFLADGKAGRGSENKVPFVVSISVDDEGYPGWVNMVLGNAKTSLSGAYHAFDFNK